MEQRQVKITTEFIKLDALLKFEGLAGTGGGGQGAHTGRRGAGQAARPAPCGAGKSAPADTVSLDGVTLKVV